MDVQEKILNLDRVKVQLLISWLSHQELIKLIKSSMQDLEDYILDNISKDGRKILLDYLSVTEEEFKQRLNVRKKVNQIYLELMKETDRVLKGSERKALQKDCLKHLSEDELKMLNSRNREKEMELSASLLKEIEQHLDRLDRGKSLKA